MKADSQKIEATLKKINNQASFINELLKDALLWPIADSIQKIEDISYSWTAEELNAEGLNKETVSSDIWQIQPLRHGQPWGVFILEFKKPDVLTGQRGLTGNLRKLLRGLVAKRRKQPNQPVWRHENLLFVCTHKYQYFKFAYFKIPADGAKTAPLVTFGWGPDTPARTACEFNLPELTWPDDGVSPLDWIEKWAKAFDVEAVTKKFFEEYHNVFKEAEREITGIKGAEQKRLFAQKLFNRLLFIAFIQKKGWLKLNGTTDSGSSADYLNALWQESKKANADDPLSEDNFYSSRLKFLFFRGLNTPNEVNIIGINKGGFMAQLIGQVPYLNGGLFEEEEDDKDSNINVPNHCFDRIFTLFNRFNFTVTESTPLDMEVAVDPEMLGKVFEELVTDRHGSGSYYTPKPIVSFMCREGLKSYLAGRLEQESKQSIDRFVDEHDSFGLKKPEAVLDAIRSVRVCDPACGSGAYLVGMLHELLDLRQALFASKGLDAKTGYDRKLEIIETNLYGVDLDPFAVNIARLRLWLSLAVEYDGNKPPPLPNLDYKIEAGNSVTAPIPYGSKRQFDLYREGDEKTMSLIREYQKKKAEYITSHHEKKKALKKEVEALRESISERAHPGERIEGFDWHVEYAEVFLPDSTGNSFGGFDVVVANPPYIRHELIKEMKPLLKKTFEENYTGTADLYCYFYFRALELLAPKGMLVFISSNKWFRAKYGDKLKAHIAATCNIQGITDFGDLSVFIGATAYPMIFVAQKETVKTQTPCLTEVKSLDAPYPNMLAVVRKYGRKLTEGAINGPEWRFSGALQLDRIRKMESAGIPLGEYVQGKIYYGIKTGFNEAFVIDGATRAELIADDPRSAEIIKPLAEGRDIKKWRVEKKDKWLIFTRRGIDIEKYPAIKKHLHQWKVDLTPKKPTDDKDSPGRKPGRYKWFEIQDDIAYYEAFDQPKIVFPDIAKEPRFAFFKKPLYLSNTAYVMPTDDLFLLGVLNSSHIEPYYIEISSSVRGDYLRFIRQYVERLPIPKASAKEKAAIATLAQKCLDAKGENCEALEQEIDSLVALLYGL